MVRKKEFDTEKTIERAVEFFWKKVICLLIKT